MLGSSVIHHGFMLKVITLGRTAAADRQLWTQAWATTTYLIHRAWSQGDGRGPYSRASRN